MMKSILSNTKIVPVVVTNTVEEGIGIAKALKKGGLNTIEITLRTEKALEIMESIIKEVEGMTVGAGTV
ncbi:MAG: keto-deoxy-phosphogluconate aldolase, partial [Oligoflexales bacterium]|nr:keto-deoxy-phosphogluconate aldolase [Oligoflexales bacterium]